MTRYANHCALQRWTVGDTGFCELCGILGYNCQQPLCAVVSGTPVGDALHLGGARRARGWCWALSTLAVPKMLVPGIALQQNQEHMFGRSTRKQKWPTNNQMCASGDANQNNRMAVAAVWSPGSGCFGVLLIKSEELNSSRLQRGNRQALRL